LAGQFWQVMRENITVREDLGPWWVILRDGAEPLIESEDADFVAQAMALLPPLPFGPTTWADWTSAVKEATGRKGKGLFMPLRRALTGQAHGPEMADFLPLMQRVRGRG
jgi:glutamyl-tRNA synthetase